MSVKINRNDQESSTKMKTSSYQFELLVSFMEENGDLCKPQGNIKDKIAALSKWEELTGLLNRDANGESKECSKWKKVWADFKNNTKKKLARMQKTHQQGGSKGHAKLSELELRVLSIAGVPVEVVEEATVTGDEAGSPADEDGERTEDSETSISYTDIPVSLKRPRSADHTYHAGQSGQPGFTEPSRSPGPPESLRTPESSKPQLSAADIEWRRFQIQQHNDYMELKREQNRLRRKEIEVQLGWQDLGAKALNLLEKFAEVMTEKRN